jgi:hypothetical protein
VCPILHQMFHWKLHLVLPVFVCQVYFICLKNAFNFTSSAFGLYGPAERQVIEVVNAISSVVSYFMGFASFWGALRDTAS